MADFKLRNSPKEEMSAIFLIVFVSASILANLFIGFNLYLFAIMMLLGASIAFLNPRSGVLAMVFLTFIFERFFTLQPILVGRSEYKLYPLDIILGAVIMGTVLQLAFRKIKPELRKIDLLLAAFILFNIIYFIFSVSVLRSDVALAFSTFKNYAWYSLFYFLILFLFREKEQVWSLFRFALAGAVGILFFIGFGLANGYGLWSEYTPLSTEGVRLLAFTHAFYLALVLIGLLIFVLFQRERIKLWQYGLMLCWTFGIVASMMRHLWIALAGVALIICWMVPEEQRKKLAALTTRGVLALLLLGALFFFLAQIFPQSSANDLYYSVQNVMVQRVGSLLGVRVSADESFSWRTVVWKEALRDYVTQPLFGIGFGKMIFIEIEKYRDIVEVRNIHNSPLILLVQMGVVGMATLGVLVFRLSEQLYRKSKGDWLDYFLLAVWAFYLIAFLFQPYLETNLLGIFFWMILGLIRTNVYGPAEFRNP